MNICYVHGCIKPSIVRLNLINEASLAFCDGHYDAAKVIMRDSDEKIRKILQEAMDNLRQLNSIP